MTTTEIAGRGRVFAEENVHTRYGPKVVLGGDTYEAFGRDDLNDEVAWDETHLTFDGDRSEWMVDANDHALSLVRETVTANGYEWGHVAADVADVLAEVHPDPTSEYESVRFDGGWSDEDDAVDATVTIEVTYTSNRGDHPTKVRSGTVVGFREDGGQVYFDRDDGQRMKVDGNDLKTDNPRYPFVGWVESVVVRVDGEQVAEFAA